MKYIFLDIDGVLNSEIFYSKSIKQAKKSLRKQVKKGEIEPIVYHTSQIDYRAISLLNDLIESTAAEVIISSTWRLANTIDYLQTLFELKGFKGKIVGTTAFMETIRGLEVQQFVDEHHIENYVIIDDDNDFTDFQRLNKWVEVDRWIGITPTVIDKAIKILKPK